MADTPHASATGDSLHEDKRVKQPVRAASTGVVTLTAPGATIDGVTLSSGDRVLLKNQSTGNQNGIYVWTGAASTLTRAPDATSSADFVFSFLVGVREGTVNAGTYWIFTQTAAFTVGTTTPTFSQLGSAGTGEISGTDFKATGLTGATAASRYIGGIGTGAPTSGPFLLGDFGIDQTGKIWICTVAGTPGTWTQADTTIAGLTGATATSRLAGATAGGAPTAGTFATGDVVFDQTGKQWICTAGGSPGTFDQANRIISGGLNGQTLQIASLTELLTIAAAATSTTALQIPAGVILLAASVRVTVAIPTATTFTVIGNTSTTVFNTAAVPVAVNSTDAGTAAGAFYNATAQTVRITPNGTPGANTGRVRVTIFYILSTPPTS